MKCSKCGSRDIDFQESTGQSICISCGTVLEESTIVSSIEFQESGDRSHVIGQYVAANCTKPYLSGSRMMNRHAESRDTALINARRVISQLASSLKLPPIYVDRAYRLFQLALQRNLIFGRRQTHLVATCLYIICRQEKSPFLLIDFSDILQINVFVLGRAFLQFANLLNISLPIVDPSLYIHRYASQFDFNDKQPSVITTSLRIVTRLKKDWIVTGRRPDGVCATALLIAARAHGFNISHETVASLFRIANDTVRKRLMEFKQTPSAQLNLMEFHQNDSTVEYDPPAFIKNMLKEHQESIELVVEEEGCTPLPDAKDLANDEVYRNLADEEEEEEVDELDDVSTKKGVKTVLGGRTVHVPFPDVDGRRKASHSKQQERLALYDSIYSEVFESSSSAAQKEALQQEAEELENDLENVGGWGERGKGKLSDKKTVLVVSVGQRDKSMTPAVVKEGENGEEPDKPIEEVAPMSDNEAMDYLYNDEEKAKRTLIWDKTFGSFMEERARRKREREKVPQETNGDRYTETGKLRKKYSKKATGKGATASEAVLSSTAASRVSKNINYDALKGMFGSDGAFAFPGAPAEGAAGRKDKEPPVVAAKAVVKPPVDAPVVGAKVAAAPKAPQKEAAVLHAPENDEDEDEDMLLYEGDGGAEPEYEYDDEYY